jgi:hypothetical protein
MLSIAHTVVAKLQADKGGKSTTSKLDLMNLRSIRGMVFATAKVHSIPTLYAQPIHSV